MKNLPVTAMVSALKMTPFSSLFFLLLLSACFHSSTESDVSKWPSGIEDFDEDKQRDSIRIASYNMAVGFGVTDLLFTDFENEEEVYLRLGKMIEEYRESLPQQRIEAMAAEIADRELQVVGLQEVLYLVVNDSVEGDFISQLTQAIADRGGPAYQVVRDSLNEISLGPYYYADTLGVSFFEGNALLVHPSLTLGGWFSQKYATVITTALLDREFTSERAYVFAEVMSPAGKNYQFFNTHLELGGLLFQSFQNAQASDLLFYAESLHVEGATQVLLGDFNFSPTADIKAGFADRNWVDAWEQAGIGAGGTCCVNIRHPGVSGYDERIDYIFARGITGVLESETALTDWFLTAEQDSLYASDHAMVTANIETQY